MGKDKHFTFNKGTEKMKLIRVFLFIAFILFTVNGASYADSDVYTLLYEQTIFQDDSPYFQHMTPISNIRSSLFSEDKSSLDMGFLHKSLGYGTLLLAGVAGATGSDSSAHHYSAVGAATLGLMTLATGYYEYGDMFEIDEGYSKYNLHIALGTIGAIGLATEAIIASTDSSHGGLGIGSAAVMGAAFIIIIW
jgi:hypothetical protein